MNVSRRLARLIALPIAAVVAVSACSGGTGQAAGTSALASGNPAHLPDVAASRYGEAAANLVSQVPGCAAAAPMGGTELQSLAPSLGSSDSLAHTYASAASCTLRGHALIVFGFTSRSKQLRAESVVDRIEFYYARGTGWIAATPVESAPAEQSSVQDVALALNGLIEQGAG